MQHNPKMSPVTPIVTLSKKSSDKSSPTLLLSVQMWAKLSTLSPVGSSHAWIIRRCSFESAPHILQAPNAFSHHLTAPMGAGIVWCRKLKLAGSEFQTWNSLVLWPLWTSHGSEAHWAGVESVFGQFLLRVINLAVIIINYSILKRPRRWEMGEGYQLSSLSKLG